MNSSALDVSVIIVSYNVKYFLEQCLYALQRAMNDVKAEVFIVDNNSSDGSVAFLSGKFPSFHFITNQKNVGFGKACNQPLSLTKGKYILFLNPDTIVAEDSLINCIEFMNSNENSGALGCKMIDGAGNFLPESKRSFPSVAASFFKLSGLSSVFPKSRIFNQYALGYLNENKTHEVDVLCGAFMMVKKEGLEKTKGFDEDFFMYAEDIDLSYRIKQQGYSNYYFAGTTIVHFKGESSKQQQAKHLYSFYEAMRIFVRKHYKNKSAGLLSASLSAAIYFRSFISFISIPLKKTKKLLGSSRKKNILLVGDEKAAVELKNKLQRLCSVDATFDIQKEKDDTEFIFCIDSFTNKEAIDLLNTKLKNKKCKFYHSSSSSAVGSNDKNINGEVYIV